MTKPDLPKWVTEAALAFGAKAGMGTPETNTIARLCFEQGARLVLEKLAATVEKDPNEGMVATNSWWKHEKRCREDVRKEVIGE